MDEQTGEQKDRFTDGWMNKQVNKKTGLQMDG